MLQIPEQAPAVAHETQQPAPRMVVRLVLAQVLGEMVDALGEERDLHLRVTGVAFVCAELLVISRLRSVVRYMS